MADAVTTQILVDGPQYAVIKFTNISDGTGESAVQKVDVSALEGSPSEVSIEQIEYSIFGMSVDILWDAATDEVAWILCQNSGTGKHDFSEIGGLRNNAGTGKTGDINFTTSGHTAADRYSILLTLRKR